MEESTLAIPLVEQGHWERLSCHTQMLSHIPQHRIQGSDSQGTVCGNGHVMLATHHRRQAHMATCLTRDLVAVLLEQHRQFRTGQISRQSHAANTSWRTM